MTILDDKFYHAQVTQRVDFAPDLWMFRIRAEASSVLFRANTQPWESSPRESASNVHIPSSHPHGKMKWSFSSN